MPSLDVVLIRMDKIGDLVLSLPAAGLPALKGKSVTWIIAKGTEFVVEAASPKPDFVSFDKRFSLANFLATWRWFRRVRPKVAVILYAPTWIYWVVWLARVPLRGGRQSRLSSFLLLNRGVRQSRSRSEKHESDYNYELIAKTFSEEVTPYDLKPLKLNASKAVNLSRWGLQSGSYFVVHPGMAGSALNWPTEHYAELIKCLIPTFPVVITGTAIDREYLEPLKAQFTDEGRIVWLDGQLNPDDLLGVLALSRAVIAPSTGVLHLAASLGRPSIGLYSPLQSHSPVRWGPRGAKVAALLPDRSVGEVNEIMRGLKVEKVLLQLKKWELS